VCRVEVSGDAEKVAKIGAKLIDWLRLPREDLLANREVRGAAIRWKNGPMVMRGASLEEALQKLGPTLREYLAWVDTMPPGS
jgi:hypothetical protein